MHNNSFLKKIFSKWAPPLRRHSCCRLVKFWRNIWKLFRRLFLFLDFNFSGKVFNCNTPWHLSEPTRRKLMLTDQKILEAMDVYCFPLYPVYKQSAYLNQRYSCCVWHLSGLLKPVFVVQPSVILAFDGNRLLKT